MKEHESWSLLLTVPSLSSDSETEEGWEVKERLFCPVPQVSLFHWTGQERHFQDPWLTMRRSGTDRIHWASERRILDQEWYDWWRDRDLAINQIQPPFNNYFLSSNLAAEHSFIQHLEDWRIGLLFLSFSLIRQWCWMLEQWTIDHSSITHCSTVPTHLASCRQNPSY